MHQEEPQAVVVPIVRLVDWLAERKLLPKHWRTRTQALQLKVTEAGKRLPLALQSQLASSTDYRAVIKIRDRLAETAEKNFLGFYTGEAGVWDKIARAYEKESLHIGEAVLTLVRNGAYEIPYIRVHIGKQQQQLIDYEKKQAEYANSAEKAQREYQQDCASLGIKGENVPVELWDLTKELPTILYDAALKLRAPLVKDAQVYYSSFIAYTSGQEVSTQPDTLLPILMEARLAELHKQKAEPVHPEGKGHLKQTMKMPTAGQELGWDLDSSSNQAGVEIDWELDTEPEPLDTDLYSVPSGAGDATVSSAIAMENRSSQEEQQPADFVARLVNDSNFRTQLLLEVMELACFLQQRTNEMASSTQSHIAAVAPEAIQQAGLPSLRQMLTALLECQEALTAERIKQLLALKTSSCFFSRMTAALQQQATQEAKFNRLQQEMAARRQELQGKLREDSARLSGLVSETRDLKAMAESELCALLRGRKVNITGEINDTMQ